MHTCVVDGTVDDPTVHRPRVLRERRLHGGIAERLLCVRPEPSALTAADRAAL